MLLTSHGFVAVQMNPLNCAVAQLGALFLCGCNQGFGEQLRVHLRR